MTLPDSNIQRLIAELKELALGLPPDYEQWRKLRERVAGLALTALRDDGHPLAIVLAELCANEVASPPKQDNKASADSYDQNRRFLTPQPGSPSAAQQHYWPLQLLLYTIATSTQRERLIDLLVIKRNALENAVRKAHAASIEFWSFQQHAKYLAQAVSHLSAPSPDLILSPDSRTLTLGGTKAKLSVQQGRFMRLLLDHQPKPVPPAKLASAGINYPAKTKERLILSAAKQGIHLTIASGADSYALVSWILSP